jgi:pimeloyl-ACP methyl ester carboxylesterase
MEREEHMPHKNRTNVRASWEEWLRRGFKALGNLSPALAAALAARLFLRAPARRKNSDRDREVLAAATPFEVEFDGETLRAWRWGHGPVVLLVHGWGGSAGQLRAFVAPLVQAGFSVVAFDAPGHGASTGRWLSLPRFASAIAHVAASVGPLHAVVAHSFGGPASSFAMHRGLQVARAVQIGPPADALAWFRKFSRHLGLPEGVALAAQDRVERRVGIGLGELNAQAIEPFVTRPLLVLHDRQDAEVPWSDGRSIAKASPNAILRTTDSLGHRRILRDPQVIADVVRFVAGEELALDTAVDGRAFAETPAAEGETADLSLHCSRCGDTLEDSRGEITRLCDRCELHVELFDRAARWERIRERAAAA